ncbi:MAG: single-stranded DNA-binding protein [Candidatus Dependentiae bacterium]|nr:single-stranded DNA-binding protein [Candidatus Dependentiae bacterium]
MAGYNRVIIVGNLTRDPELRQLQSGANVCRLNIASNRQYKDRQTGSVNQEVCFVDVDVWGPQADSCKQYLQKGRAVLVEGRLKLDSWKDADGGQRSKHSIVANTVQFLFGADQAQAPTDTEMEYAASAAPAAAASSARSAGRSKKLDQAPFDEELPF